MFSVFAIGFIWYCVKYASRIPEQRKAKRLANRGAHVIENSIFGIYIPPEIKWTRARIRKPIVVAKICFLLLK